MEGKGYLNPVDFKEVRFEQRDLDIFRIQDAKTKLATLQNYFFPRMEIMLRHSVELARKIYGINPFETMTVVRTPNHRKDAKNVVDHNICQIGLSGKRTDDALIITHSNGEPFKFHPSSLLFRIDPSTKQMHVGLCFFNYLVNEDFVALATDSLSKNAKALQSLFNALQIGFWSGDPFLTFRQTLGDMKNPYRVTSNGQFAYSAYCRSPVVGFPVDGGGIRGLARSFTGLYPILDSMVLLGRGEKPRLEEMLPKFVDWWYSEDQEDKGDSSDDGEPNEDIQLPELDSYAIIRPKLWWDILARDNWTCVSCGRSAKTGIILNIDHIVPRSRGGTNDRSNLQTLCWKCNIGKSNRDKTNLRDS